VVFREITAGALALVGAAGASVWLIDYSRTNPMPWPALVTDSLALAAFWVVCERATAWWRTPGKPSPFPPFDEAFPYVVTALLVHLPWRVPLEGAYLISSWTGLALLLIVFSLPCRQVHYRYAGLAVFALAIGRAFLDINSTLTGFNKAAAFAVLCFVLLVVAYGYHRAMLVLAAGPAHTSSPDNPAEHRE
jgi:hypothetical protein